MSLSFVKGIKLVPEEIVKDHKIYIIYRVIPVQPISKQTGLQFVIKNNSIKNNSIKNNLSKENIKIYLYKETGENIIINDIYNVEKDENYIYINCLVVMKYSFYQNDINYFAFVKIGKYATNKIFFKPTGVC